MYQNLRKVIWMNLFLSGFKLVTFVFTWSLVALYGSLHDLFDAANTGLAIKLHRRGRESLTVILNALLLLGGSAAVIVWSLFKLQNEIAFEPVSWLMVLAGLTSLWGNTYNFVLTHRGQSRTENILCPHYLEDILDGMVLLVLGGAAFWVRPPAAWDPLAAIGVAVVVSVFTVSRLVKKRLVKKPDGH